MGKSREEDSKIQNMLEFLELSRVSRPHYDIQDLDNVEWVAVGYLLRPQHVVREYDLLQSFMRFLKQFPTFQHAVIASGGKILAWGNEKSDQIVQLLEFITEKWYTVSHSQFSAEIVHLDKHDTNALAKLRRVVYQADISQFWEESGIRHYDTDTIIIKPSIDIEIFGSQFINGIFLVGLDTPDIILEGLLSELKVKCSTREGIIQVITDFFTLVTHKIGELGIKSDITVLRHQLQKVVMLRDTISKVRILLFSFVKEVVDKIYSTKKTSAQTAVEWAQVFIQNNYWLDITLEFISSKLYLSPAYFSRIFKKYNGQGFSQYINSIRMEKAKSLLLTGKYSVAEVAEKIGIQDPSYFHYVFKKYHNTTPGYFIGLQNKNITCSV
jgi:AraC-like DNA-binding protein